MGGVSRLLFFSFLFLSSPALSLSPSFLPFPSSPPFVLSLPSLASLLSVFSLFLYPFTLLLVLSPSELSPPFKHLSYSVLAAIGLLVLCVLVIPERERRAVARFWDLLLAATASRPSPPPVWAGVGTSHPIFSIDPVGNFIRCTPPA